MPFIPLFQSPKSFYRLAVASFFFLQGLVFASWASRIPDIKQALDLNEAQLGGVLFAIPVGQMSAMALSGYLVSRFGSHRMLLLAALLYSGTLMALGFISETWHLFAMLVFFGVAANLHNISVNTQAVGVERLYRRSIMASHIPARTKFDNLLLTGQNLTVHGAIGVTLSAAATCSEIVGTEYLAKKIANA